MNFFGWSIVITSNSFSIECIKEFEVKFRRVYFKHICPQRTLFLCNNNNHHIKWSIDMKSKLIYLRNKIVWVLVCILNWFANRSSPSHINGKITSIYCSCPATEINGKRKKKTHATKNKQLKAIKNTKRLCTREKPIKIDKGRANIVTLKKNWILDVCCFVSWSSRSVIQFYHYCCYFFHI